MISIVVVFELELVFDESASFEDFKNKFNIFRKKKQKQK